MVPTDTDRANHRATVAACKTLGFNATEVDTLWRVVAAVLHLVRMKHYFSHRIIFINLLRAENNISGTYNILCDS